MLYVAQTHIQTKGFVMRLSLVSAILLNTLAYCFYSAPALVAQSPVTEAAAPTPSLQHIGQEAVPSPLANWHTNVEDSTAFLTTGIDSAKKTSVLIEISSIAVDLDCEVRLKSFFKRGSFEVHTGSMPSIDVNAGVGESRLSSIDTLSATKTNTAAACQSVRRAMPVMLAKLDAAGTLKIKQALSTEKTTASPTVVCYSGQTATVSDMNFRPFVVGVKPIVSEVAVAHQPVIQLIEDGYMFRINPIVNDGKIDLKANFVHSKVSSVDTFKISGTEESGVAVQIPEQTVKQVNVSASLQDGETLFLDPRLQIEVEQDHPSKLPFKKSKSVTTTKQVYFLVTTTVVDDAPPSQRLSQAK